MKNKLLANITPGEILEGVMSECIMRDRLTQARRSWNMSRIRGRDTAPEKRVRSMLHGMGHRFRLHVRELPGCPDIVLPKYKIVVLRGQHLNFLDDLRGRHVCGLFITPVAPACKGGRNVRLVLRQTNFDTPPPGW